MRRRAHAIGFVVVALLLAGTVVTLPFAVLSMADDLRATDVVVRLTPADVPVRDTHSYLKLEVLSLDDVRGTIEVRVSGHHICDGCPYGEQITLYAISDGDTGRRSEGIPPSAHVSLPATADTVTTMIELPVQGSLVGYPFETYRVWLGATYARVQPGGKTELLSRTEAQGRLILDIRNGAPRTQMRRLNDPDPSTVQPLRGRVEYVAVHGLELYRPAFLRLAVPLIVALITAAAFYAVVLRPFQELIISNGALVLGIWGVRSLLLGSYPPNTTIVDAFLTLLIVVMLCVISLRALFHMHDSAGLSVLRKRDPPAQS